MSVLRDSMVSGPDRRHQPSENRFPLFEASLSQPSPHQQIHPPCDAWAPEELV